MRAWRDRLRSWRNGFRRCIGPSRGFLKIRRDGQLLTADVPGFAMRAGADRKNTRPTGFDRFFGGEAIPSSCLFFVPFVNFVVNSALASSKQCGSGSTTKGTKTTKESNRFHKLTFSFESLSKRPSMSNRFGRPVFSKPELRSEAGHRKLPFPPDRSRLARSQPALLPISGSGSKVEPLGKINSG